MKTFKEVLELCIECTFYNQYGIERLVELNYVCGCTIDFLSKCNFISEGSVFSVLGVIDVLSLVVFDRNCNHFDEKINILRVDILQLPCSEKLYQEEADKENMEAKAINRKEIISYVKMEFF